MCLRFWISRGSTVFEADMEEHASKLGKRRGPVRRAVGWNHLRRLEGDRNVRLSLFDKTSRNAPPMDGYILLTGYYEFAEGCLL